MTYDSRDCIVEHNYFRNNASGIFWKGDHDWDEYPQQDNITRFNFFEDGAHANIYSYANLRGKIYQNIFYGGQRGIRQHNNATQTQGVKVVNNTIVAKSGSSVGITHPVGTNYTTGFQGFNNILYGPWAEDVNIGMSPIGPLSYEHNVYYGYIAWGSYAGAQHTFAQWQAAGQDSVAPTGINADPLFVNTSSGDFHLQAGSPARNRGVDILDLDGDGSTTDIINAGAYITGNEVIGIDTGSTPAPTVSLSASPTTINPGGSSTLTWSSTNATSCTASGAWSGTRATSGTQSVSPTSTSTYTLTCTGTGGSGNASATVTVNPATPTACHTVNTTNFSQAGYNAYGAPFDPYQTTTNLMQAQCTSGNPNTLTATLGVTGDTTRIVYTRGYWYDAVGSAWRQYTGTCTGAQNGDWCQGSVSATITDANVSTASASSPTYFVGMVCRMVSGQWKCGCRDTTCNSFYWQIQGAGL